VVDDERHLLVWHATQSLTRTVNSTPRSPIIGQVS
jgi:hypothetical protein